MKKAGAVIAVLVCVSLVCGIFAYVLKWNQPSVEDQVELTNVQKVITKKLDTNYPATPREVVKFYNRILKCYYSEDASDKEFDELTDQALKLFDDELAANNPKDQYEQSVKADVEAYKEQGKTIAQYNVCDSNDIIYKNVDGDNIAFVGTSYFMKEDNNCSKTYQTYVLRKDTDNHWKILVFYQTADPNAKEEES